MRNVNGPVGLVRLAITATLLASSVFVTGCASKKAADQSANSQTDRLRIAVRARQSVRQAQLRRRQLGRGSAPSRAYVDDAARYADVYGVAPPPAYHDDTGRQEAIGIMHSLPADTASARPAQQVLLRGERHIVVTGGDTLYSIASHYNTTVTALLIANGLRRTNIDVGQELIIPAGRL